MLATENLRKYKKRVNSIDLDFFTFIVLLLQLPSCELLFHCIGVLLGLPLLGVC